MKLYDKKFLIYGNCMIRSFVQPGKSISLSLFDQLLRFFVQVQLAVIVHIGQNMTVGDTFSLSAKLLNKINRLIFLKYKNTTEIPTLS